MTRDEKRSLGLFAGGFAVFMVLFEILVIGWALDAFTVLFALVAAIPATIAWWSVRSLFKARRDRRAEKKT